MAKIYIQHSVGLSAGERCRVTTYRVRIPVSVVNLVVLGVEPDLPACKSRKFRGSTMVGWEVHTGRGVDDEQNRGHEREEEDGSGEDGSCGPAFDQGCDENGTNTLSGLVNSLSSAHWKTCPSVGDRSDEPDGALRTLCEGVGGLEPIRGEGRDRPVKKFEAQLVEHYASDIDGTE